MLRSSRQNFEIFLVTYISRSTYIQNAAIEWNDFQIAVLMNWDEYKKHKQLQSIAIKCQLIYV
jgi:hypothetical protein